MKRMFALAALGTFLCASTATAQSPGANDRSAVVAHADLNLASEAGLAELERRIGLAVRQVCGAASDADLKGRNEVRRCRSRTRALVSASRGKAIAAARSPSLLASQ